MTRPNERAMVPLLRVDAEQYGAFCPVWYPGCQPNELRCRTPRGTAGRGGCRGRIKNDPVLEQMAAPPKGRRKAPDGSRLGNSNLAESIVLSNGAHKE